ncbi:MAG: serine hydrolase [Acidobacteria bacterium]|nr:serine hydrolase [Acidobacteriota bacterium]
MIAFLLMLLLLPCGAFAQPKRKAAAAKPARTMASHLNTIVERAPGTVSVYAKNLDTGRVFSIRGEQRVRTASIIKLPIMIAAFGEVAAGRAQWTDKVALRKEDRVSGSGILNEFSDGLEIPLIDLVRVMIVVSDNTATNLVLDRITADTVNRYLDEYGLPETRSLRKVRGDGGDLKSPSGFSEAGKREELQKYGLGVTTMKDMVALLERIERGQAISAEASREMITILKRQRYHEAIPRKLGSTVVANKTGALNALRSDVGIVYAKRGRIAIAVTIDDMKKADWTVDNPGHLVISEIARVLVNEL